MRRFLSLFLGVVLFFGAFFGALWAFMPWREVAASALSLGASSLEGRGIRLRYAGLEPVEGGFAVEGISLEGFLTVAFDEVTVRPQFLSSLMSLAPTCEVSFRGGRMTLGQPMSFGNGSVLLTVSPGEALLERLRTDGEFSLQGFLTVDLAQMRIGRAEASVKVPASFEENMDVLGGFLPLVREKDGGWFLRRHPDGGEK